MDIFFEIHKDLPQEGPGDNPSTRKAFSRLAGLPQRPSILDIGCGPGRQTLELASLTDGHIVAVDNHQPFLDALMKKARDRNFSDKITVANASMFDLTFEPESFDAIWSEGAIYIIGLERGLKAWRRFLKAGGYVAVTEVAWLRPDPPEEIRDFWTANYPQICAIEENAEIIRAAGYIPVDFFALPPSSWWDNYYLPLEARIALLRDKYREDAEAAGQLDVERHEIELFRKYSDWYGYVFFMMRAV
jgi:SAM-dependent methyltransferase